MPIDANFVYYGKTRNRHGLSKCPVWIDPNSQWPFREITADISSVISSES